MAEGLRALLCDSEDCPVCGLCGAFENLFLCSGCRDAWYCCKEHQQSDWKAHKRICKRKRAGESTNNSCSATCSDIVRLPASNSIQPNNHRPIEFDLSSTLLNPLPGTRTVSALDALTVSETQSCALGTEYENSCRLPSGSFPTCTATCESECAEPVINSGINNRPIDASLILGLGDCLGLPVQMTPSSKTKTDSMRTLSTTAVTGGAIGKSSRKSLLNGNYPGKVRNKAVINPHTLESSNLNQISSAVKPDVSVRPKGSISHVSTALNPSLSCGQHTTTSNMTVPEPETKLADYVVSSLKNYGICVIDQFMGTARGDRVRAEVLDLEQRGVLEDGELINKIQSKKKIRGDKITWIEKTDQTLPHIGALMQRIDSLVMTCNEKLDEFNINGRTKAMVAMYPSNGAGYMRHVDNPSGDGRCMTSIYYLNKDWDAKKHGGILRIFPERFKQVADIEPKFDRLLFFWADRRNPHEVQPAHRTRFAVTVWYFDADERARAKFRYHIQVQLNRLKKEEEQNRERARLLTNQSFT